MKISKIGAALLIACGLLLSITSANAQECSFQEVELKCNAEARTAEAILTAFASEKTRELLSNPLSQSDKFSQNGDLEKYRQSMERNWRVITRFAKLQQRNKNRRRISEADFQVFSKRFEEAEKSYVVALNFYRQLHWQGLK